MVAFIRYLGFVFLLLTVFLVLPQPASCQESEDQILNMGQEIKALRESGNYPEALVLAQKILSLQQSQEGAPVWDLQNAQILVADLEYIVSLDPPTRQELALADSLGSVAELSLTSRNIDQAEEALTQQLEIRRRLLGVHQRELIESLAWLGYCRQMRGDFAGAVPFFEEALSISRIILGDEHPDVASNLLNLGFTLARKGQPEEASGYTREGLVLCRKLYGDEHPDTAWALNNLGTDFHKMGDYLGAEPLYRRGLAVLRILYGEANPEIGMILNNLGQIHMQQGNYAQAEQQFREALANYEVTLGEEHPEIASTLASLASALDNQGRIAEAEVVHRQALVMKREVHGEQHPSLALSLVNLGKLKCKTGQFTQADSLFAEALAIQKASLGESHPIIVLTLDAMANVRMERGELEAAEALYQEALIMSTNLMIGPHPNTVRLLVNLGHVQRQTGQLSVAENTFADAATMFEKVRLRAGFGLDRSTFLAAPHLELAATRLKMGKNEAAWDPLGCVQSRYLDDQMLLSNSGELNGQEMARRDSLTLKLTGLEDELTALAKVSQDQRDANFPRRIENLQIEILNAEADLGSFQEEMTQKYPATEGRRFSLAEVQATLDSEAAIVGWLDVQISKDQYAAWGYVIRNTGAVSWKPLEQLPGDNPFDQSRDLLEGLLDVGFMNDWDESQAHTVWQSRFGPLVDDLDGVEELIVIPSGPMLGVPVETLVDAQGNLLGNRYTINYSPSWNIHTWLATLSPSENRPARDRILLLGDPPFGESETVNQLPQLTGTRSEVNRIAGDHPKSTVLLGRQASEKALLKLSQEGDLAGYGTLHLATHALVDDERPERSALVLSLVDLPDPFEAVASGQRIFDGMLTCQEIAQEWSLEADLVVLSACETGLGRRVGAEGYIGFSHAFLQAGAHGLLVSLWKVDDEATALLMGEFYNIRTRDDKKSNAQALQEAKIWLREYKDDAGNQPFDHPFFWSSFILIGSSG